MPRRADSLITPAFVALTVSDLAYFTAGGALLGVTPFFVTGPLGSGPGAVGATVGAFSVTTLVARPLAGRWTDRRGRRPLLVAGAAAFAVLVLAHLWVTGLAGLLALRLLLGVAEALYVVAGFAALADLAPPGRAGEALAASRRGASSWRCSGWSSSRAGRASPGCPTGCRPCVSRSPR